MRKEQEEKYVEGWAYCCVWAERRNAKCMPRVGFPLSRVIGLIVSLFDALRRPHTVHDGEQQT